MLRTIALITLIVLAESKSYPSNAFEVNTYLSTLKPGQNVGDLRAENVYRDAKGSTIGAKFTHSPSGAPIYVLQIETAPQAFMWVDAPATANNGLPHALEHLLAGKGTTGRYSSLLTGMRLSHSEAATSFDCNFYGFASGTGLDGFFEQFNAWLMALFQSDFTDVEAEREFYHFAGSASGEKKESRLIEQGTVYNEETANQGVWDYYFGLNQLVFGAQNPLSFAAGGRPSEMRHQTPAEIRRFYQQHYHLSPTTGFIFVIDPRSDVHGFLANVDWELRAFVRRNNKASAADRGEISPKYPIHASTSTAPKIFPFPSQIEEAPGEVRLGWKATKIKSVLELKYFQLLLDGVAGGQQSLLYRDIIDKSTRRFDSSATQVSATAIMDNSPFFPVATIGVSGIPGNLISSERLSRLRQQTIQEFAGIAEYADGSAELLKFNRSALETARSWKRSEDVWAGSAPLFGFLESGTKWKDHLSVLEMDPTFARELTNNAVWKEIENQLSLGKNLWKSLIHKNGFLNEPYITASAPSTSLLNELLKQQQDRARAKMEELRKTYKTNDDRLALDRFAQSEAAKTAEINAIAGKVSNPHFTQTPALTHDDGVQFEESRLPDDVPVVSIFFDRAPTIDVGLSFDLTGIPSELYRYIPLLPRSFDSLGLRDASSVVPYRDLLSRIRNTSYALDFGFSSNPVSKRADFTLTASAVDLNEFHSTLALIQDLLRHSDLSIQNLERLRAVVAARIAANEANATRNDQLWTENPAYAFRYADQPLYLALNSYFTRAHWDERLAWMLHEPVGASEIADLLQFSDNFTRSLSGLTRDEVTKRLNALGPDGLKGELIHYWLRNVGSFAESGLSQGFRRIAIEVADDLSAGPEKAIADLKRLQTLLMDRKRLRINVTIDPLLKPSILGELTQFVSFIPAAVLGSIGTQSPLPMFRDIKVFPTFVGLLKPGASTGSVLFSADFPTYRSIKHDDLMRVLASKIHAGVGPDSFFMKAWETGLAYNNGIESDVDSGLITYYADRSPDLAGLLSVLDQQSKRPPAMKGPELVDYVFSQTFALPRSLQGFTDRGTLLAADLRDGSRPEIINRFSKAILELRTSADLPQELISLQVPAISSILLGEDNKEQQMHTKSLFFFVGSEDTLSTVEKRLHLSQLVRIAPSDFWMN